MPHINMRYVSILSYKAQTLNQSYIYNQNVYAICIFKSLLLILRDCLESKFVKKRLKFIIFYINKPVLKLKLKSADNHIIILQ